MRRYGKRIMREQIKYYRRMLDLNRSQIEVLEIENADLKKRLDVAASTIPTPDTDCESIRVIHAVKTYGTYKCLIDSDHPNQEMLYQARRCIEDLVKSLIDNRCAQIIVRDDVNPPTVAAKLYVVPWEQMKQDMLQYGVEVIYKNPNMKEME